jgi:hypothetical protein
VREGDVFKAAFTVRNASDRKMDVEIKANINSAAEQRESSYLGSQN